MSTLDNYFLDIDPDEELPRLLSSAALLRNPLGSDSRFHDDVLMSGVVSCVGGTIYIDVDDDTPAAVSSRLKVAIENQFDNENPLSYEDIEGGLSGSESLITGGSSVGVRKSGQDSPKSVRYALLKRGLYLKDNPDNGYLKTPLALNHPSGGCAERLSLTMLKEMQEELQICVMERRGDGGGGIFPLMLSFNGMSGLSEVDYAHVMLDFRNYFVKEDRLGGGVSFPLDIGGDMDSLKFVWALSDPRRVEVSLDPLWDEYCGDVVTRINGEVFDEAFGVPYFDIEHNTFELTKPLKLEIPRGDKVIHIEGCEPDFGRQCDFYTENMLIAKGLASKYPFEDGVDPGGLSRASHAFFNNYSSDLFYMNNGGLTGNLREAAINFERSSVSFCKIPLDVSDLSV